MKLKVNRINSEAKIPEYAHPGDAGMDIFSVTDQEIAAGESALIPTGIAIALPENHEAQIRPRSGLALRHQITLLNTPGTIDCGYRGEICVIVINHGKEIFRVTKGMKIAQMVVKPILQVEICEVETLDETSRGEGGFGSTGI